MGLLTKSEKKQNLLGFRKDRDQEQELRTLSGEIPEVGGEGECIGFACIVLARGSVGHPHRQATVTLQCGRRLLFKES